MLIELTEVLVCPRCPSTAGLVALIENAVSGRVAEGALGCPFCEARYPIRAAVVDLSAGAGTGPEPQDLPAASDGGVDSGLAERALMIAALLGLEGESPGYVLLDAPLAPVAGRVARLAPGREVIALVVAEAAREEPDPTAPFGGDRASGSDLEDTAVSHVRVDPGMQLPVLSGRLCGVALLDPDGQQLESATRALLAGGRLVVLQPEAELADRTERLGLRVMAKDERALVAVKDPVPG